jgi:uncharacterized protein (DUF2147 family)
VVLRGAPGQPGIVMKAGLLICLIVLVLCMASIGSSRAHASPADGTWLLRDKLAIQISDCEGGLCGRIVWLKNPALRTPAMCGRTIVWGLVPEGPSQWASGWIYDPDDGNTYHLSATLQPDNTISARIYKGIALFGETKILTRVTPADLPGRC